MLHISVVAGAKCAVNKECGGQTSKTHEVKP